MAEAIGSLRAELGLAVAKFEKDMGRAVKAVRSGSSRMKRAFGGARAASLKFAKSLFSMRSAAVAAAGTAGLFFLVKRAIDAADAIAKTADVIGISTKALQEYRFAAGLVGSSNDALDKGFKQLSKNIGELRAGTGSLTTLLQKTNPALLETLRAAENNTVAFDAFFEALAKTSSAADRAALAAAALGGRIGKDLVLLVKDGTKGLNEMRKEAQRLGLVLDEKMARQAEIAQDKLSILAQVLNVNLTRALLGLTPLIIKIAEKLGELAATAKGFIESFLPVSLVGTDELRKRAAVIREEIKEIQDEFRALEQRPPATAGLEALARTSPTLAKKLLDEALAGHKAALFAIAERIAALQIEERSLLDLAAAQDETSASAQRALELKRELAKEAKETAERNAFIEGILGRLTAAQDKLVESKQRIIEGLKFEREQLSRTEVMQQVYNLAKRAGIEVNDEFVNTVRPLVVALQEERAAVEASNRAQEVARDKLARTATGMDDLKAASMNLDRAAQDLGFTFSSAFEDAIIRGNNLRSVLDGLVQDIARIAIREAITKPLAGAFTSILGAVFSGATSFLGFRHGGQFKVGGAGGADSKLVAFRATPGETVTVTTPGAQVDTNAAVMVRQEVEVNVFAPAGTNVQTRESSTAQGGRRLDIILDDAMAKNIAPGTKTFRAIQGAFTGMNPVLVGR